MRSIERDQIEMNQALRDIIIESSEEEIRDAVASAGGDFHALASRGRAVAERALAEIESESAQDLRKGLGALIYMLRRRDGISIEDLGAQARVDPGELTRLEDDYGFDPNPRTVYQLEKHFKLPERSLVLLSGAVKVESAVRSEAVRFAASSESIVKLSREEKHLLNRFVRFLREQTDE